MAFMEVDVRLSPSHGINLLNMNPHFYYLLSDLLQSFPEYDSFV